MQALPFAQANPSGQSLSRLQGRMQRCMSGVSELSRLMHSYGAGQLEVLNAEALTEGAGAHPLFQGIRRVVVTGLEPPVVRETEGKVSVEAPGVKLEFQPARVVRDGETLTLRLGS